PRKHPHPRIPERPLTSHPNSHRHLRLPRMTQPARHNTIKKMTARRPKLHNPRSPNTNLRPLQKPTPTTLLRERLQRATNITSNPHQLRIRIKNLRHISDHPRGTSTGLINLHMPIAIPTLTRQNHRRRLQIRANLNAERQPVHSHRTLIETIRPRIHRNHATRRERRPDTESLPGETLVRETLTIFREVFLIDP